MNDLAYDDTDLEPSGPERVVRLEANIGERFQNAYYIFRLVKSEPTLFSVGVQSEPVIYDIPAGLTKEQFREELDSFEERVLLDFKDAYFGVLQDIKPTMVSKIIEYFGPEVFNSRYVGLTKIPEGAADKLTRQIQARKRWTAQLDEPPTGVPKLMQDKFDQLYAEYAGEAPLSGEELDLISSTNIANPNVLAFPSVYGERLADNKAFYIFSGTSWNGVTTRRDFAFSVKAQVVDNIELPGNGVAAAGAGTSSSGFNVPLSDLLPEVEYLVQPFSMLQRFGHLIPDVGVIRRGSQILADDIVLQKIGSRDLLRRAVVVNIATLEPATTDEEHYFKEGL